jgi:thiamine-phosphate pyrophosphorylase
MLLKKKHLRDCNLYLILDTAVYSYKKLMTIARKSVHAGVDILQLRDKSGRAEDIMAFSNELHKLTKGHVPFIINDRIDLAYISPAAGVHLGQDDLDVKETRKIYKEKRSIGLSCQTWEHFKKSQKLPIDYIGFGSVFKTLTKPGRTPMDLDLLKRVIRSATVPVFAIGGITLKNIDQLTAIGVRRVAVCRAICEAKNIESTVRQFKKKLHSGDVLLRG